MWKSPGDVNKNPYNTGRSVGRNYIYQLFPNFLEMRCISIWTSTTWSVTNRFFSRVFGRFRRVGPADPRGETTKSKSRKKPSIVLSAAIKKPYINICKLSYLSGHLKLKIINHGGGHIQLAAQDILSCPTWRSSSSWCWELAKKTTDSLKMLNTWCFISMSKIHNLSPQSRCWSPLILVVYAIPCSRSQLMRFDPTSNSPPPQKTESPCKPHFDY